MSNLRQYELGIKFMRESQLRRLKSGFKDSRVYEIGVYNGIELALATIEMRQPEYLSTIEDKNEQLA